MEQKDGIASENLVSILKSGLNSEGYEKYIHNVGKYYKTPEEGTGRLFLDEIIQTNKDIKTILDADEILPDMPWFKFSEIIAGHIKDRYGISDEVATQRVDIWYILAKKLNRHFSETCLIALSNSSEFDENQRDLKKLINVDLNSKTEIMNYDNKLPFYRNCIEVLDLLSGFVGQLQCDEDEQKLIDKNKPSQISMINDIEFLRLDPERLPDDRLIDIFNRIVSLPGGD